MLTSRMRLAVIVAVVPARACGGQPAPQTARPAALSPLASATPGLSTSPTFREPFVRWTAPFPPFTILGNVHYVGSAGLSAFLITTPRGHFLLDGGLAENGPMVAANIRALGFDITDVRYLLNSHAHFDHSGALAWLQAHSGAQLVASAGDKPWLESGHVTYGPSAEFDTEPVRVARVIADGESVELGGTTLTAMLLPGHTPGCTSWITSTRDAAGATRKVLFHCSASVGGQTVAPESYPGMVADYRRGFDRMAAITADVLLANHAEMFGLADKRARQLAGERDAFVDPAALGAFNTRLRDAFERELARQSR